MSTRMDRAMQVPLLPSPSVELDRDYVYNTLRSIALDRRVWDSISARLCYLDSTMRPRRTLAAPSILSLELDEYKFGMKNAYEKRDQLYRAYARVKKTFVKLESDVDQYLEGCTQASCRTLCDDVQRKLPRELRDDIYKRIINYPTYLPFRVEDACLKLAETGHGRAELIKSWVFDEYDHLFDIDYISPETMREFAEAWYRVVRFDLVRCLPINRVPKFFKHDLWGLDLPVHNLVRKVEVNGWEASLSKNTNVLECLLTLNRQAQVTFDFNAGLSLGKDNEGNKQAIVHRASKLFPLMNKLLDAGYKLSATFASITWAVSKENLSTKAWLHILENKRFWDVTCPRNGFR